MKKQVTIKDVANLAGLSAATVSLVLNGKGVNIPLSTKERIAKAAKELDYHPDFAARSLVTGKTNTIGIVIPDISNMFFAETVRNIQIELSKFGYDIILCNSEEQMKNDVKYVKWLMAGRVDGLILAMSAESMELSNREYIEKVLNGITVPYIFLDRYLKNGAPCVRVANNESGYSVARLLIENGHTNMGVIAGPMSLNSSANRLKGFVKALKEVGLSLPEENIVYGKYDTETGRKGAEMLLKRNVTAIFAFNDLQAYGVIAYAKEHGVNIPERLSVVGFDDLLYSSLLETKLTTVRQPVGQLASEVCKVMVGILEKTLTQGDVRLETKLVIRDSVKKLS